MSRDGAPPPFLFEIFEPLDQLGPGDDAHTVRALGHLPGIPQEPAVLDLGCGTGRQTLVLARETGGVVLAVDIHEPFLERLRHRARAAGLAARVRTEARSMVDLDLEPGSFDLVWSEGAIYLLGFAAGLEAWRPLLKPGGFLGVTEVCWLVEDPPPACREFWEAGYPAITTVEANLETLRAAGYEPLGHFPLPASCWWESYYVPLAARVEELSRERAGDPEEAALLAELREEISLFREFPGVYSYVFFLARRGA